MAKVKQTGKQIRAAAVADAKKPKRPPTLGTEIVKVSKKALSVDVGPKVVAMLARANDDETKAMEALEGVKSTRYQAISMTTTAILKAAQNDPTIKLGDAFSGDTKLMGALNDKLGIALGFREVVPVVDGDKTFYRVVPSKAVAQFWPSPTDKKGTPEYDKKNTNRSNFITLVKRAAQAAEGIIVNKMTVKASDGTLRLSGPAVVKAFGQDDVLLNENAGQKGKDKPLSAKPSFTAIRDLGAQAHDAAVSRGSNTRGTTRPEGAGTRVNADDAFRSMAIQMQMSLGKFEGPLTGKTKEAAESLVNALKAKLAETDSTLIPKK